jgi:hypothetical protein
VRPAPHRDGTGVDADGVADGGEQMAGELAQGDSASGTHSDRLVRARGGLISRQNCMRGSIEIDASRGGKTQVRSPMSTRHREDHWRGN